MKTQNSQDQHPDSSQENILETVKPALTETEMQKMIEEYDTESRYRNVVGWTKRLVSVMTITLASIILYTAGFGLLPEWIHRSMYLGFVLPLVFVLYPMNPKANWQRMSLILDGVYAVMGASVGTVIIIYLAGFSGIIVPIVFLVMAAAFFYFKIRALLPSRIYAKIDMALAILGLLLVGNFTQLFLRNPTMFTTSAHATFKLFVTAVLMALSIILGLTIYASVRRIKGDVLPLDPNSPPYFDWISAIISAAASLYIIIDYNAILQRAGQPVRLDHIIGGILILLVLEAARRSIGAPLAVFAILAIAIAFYGRSFSGIPMLDYLAHRGYSVPRIIEHLYLGTEGIYGIPTGVVATYVFHFVLLGFFISRTGLGQLFIDIAMSVAGWSAGGPAKVAVISSGLLGMISGSSVANVVTVGTFTIPLMKKIGYKADFAGGVEASASTGGQITPPVMGAAAFVMAEFLQIPYVTIALCAVIPAIIYYYAATLQVHLEALRTGLKGLPREQLPRLTDLLRERSMLLLPLVLIIYLLLIGRTPYLAAFWAILLSSSQGQIHAKTQPFFYTLFLSFPFISWLEMPSDPRKLAIFWMLWAALWAYGVWKTWNKSDKIAFWAANGLNVAMVIIVFMGYRIFFAGLVAHLGMLLIGMWYRDSKMKFRDLLESLDGGTRNALSIGAAVAAVGFIVGVTTLTGLGLKFSNITIDAAAAIAHIFQPLTFGLTTLDGATLFFTLVMTGIACIILGMGVPTTAQYIITSMIAAPALLKWGIAPLLSHMFVLYYGVLADVTPPVALAAYAAAGISGGDPFKTGFHACHLSMGKVLVPFYFVYTPSILLMPWILDRTQPFPFISLIGTLITVCLGILALSCAISGYLVDHFAWYERIFFLLLTAGFLIPEFWTSVVAFVFLVAFYFWQKARKARRMSAAAV